MDWENKNVLVTGGTGLIGGHLVESLLKKGSNIIVPYIELNSKSYFWLNKLQDEVNMVQCDIKDTAKVFDIVSKYEIDIIFHLAAQPLVPIAYINPEETLKTNIVGTISVLEAARKCPRVKAIIVASSDKAYGVNKNLPYTEDMPLQGKQPYDVSKSCADLIAQSYYVTYDLPVAITRFGNIYGPGDLNMNRIIPGAIKAAMTGETLVIRSDGKMIREYIYVKDVVKGYIILAENIDSVKGEAFNLSSGIRMSVLDVVNTISEIYGTKIEVDIQNTAKAEIPKQYLSYEKVKKAVGWVPTADIEAALKHTIEWYKGAKK